MLFDFTPSQHSLLMNKKSMDITDESKRRFELVIFDLGGTLIFFDGDWEDVVIEARQQLYQGLRDAGFDLEKTSFIKDFHNQMVVYQARRETDCKEHTTESVLRKVLEGWGYSNVEDQEISPAIAGMYAVSQKHWHVEPDTIPTLEALKTEGYQIGIISNAADDRDVQTLIDQANIRYYFDLILTSAAEGIRKPDLFIFQKALDFWNVKPSRAVMVGDNLNADILGANKAGIFSVWINRRVNMEKLSSTDKKVQPDAVINTLGELKGLLENLSW